MNPIGIMQGRLSPPLPENAQYFPAARWEQEFTIAGNLGFDSIEWLFDETSIETNPALSHRGRQRIKEIANLSGVRISSICADYFKVASLAIHESPLRLERIELLSQLIEGAAELGAGCVLVPFIEGSSMQPSATRQLARSALQVPLDLAATLGINLAVEVDLPAGELLSWLTNSPHPNLGTYYDLGNAVAMGYEPVNEIVLLAEWLRGVHIKDRTRNGPNVTLGAGEVDFTSSLKSLVKVGYKGSFILETVRGIDFVEDAQKNLDYLKDQMKTLS